MQLVKALDLPVVERAKHVPLCVQVAVEDEKAKSPEFPINAAQINDNTLM